MMSFGRIINQITTHSHNLIKSVFFYVEILKRIVNVNVRVSRKCVNSPYIYCSLDGYNEERRKASFMSRRRIKINFPLIGVISNVFVFL
uniref:Uncharacterized protein n=1 Tax=Lepeophtheirus salmonis TaxID=72036 RepID=A0A0K2TRP6_LEPSM